MPEATKRNLRKIRSEKHSSKHIKTPYEALKDFNWGEHWIGVLASGARKAEAYEYARTSARSQALCKVML